MPSDRLLGWLGPLAVTVVAGILRFWDLGKPKLFVFDETYYAKDAYALLQNGYEQDYIRKADEQILGGNLDVFAADPSYVVHPPLGKWVIATGEQLFGMDPFGWRFGVAVLGTLSVLLVARIVRRMTRSTLIGTIAGLLLALDGLHIVMSRTALLDLPLSFFLLAAFGALVMDRETGRRRAAERLDGFVGSGTGPRLGFRPWRIVAGVLLGCALGTKWNAIYFIAAFGLLTVWWDVAARRVAGARSPWIGALRHDAVPAFFSLIPAALAAYLLTWTGWFVTDGGYNRTWGAENPPGPLRFMPDWLGTIVPDSIRSLWHYHVQAFNFHSDLTSSHPYESHPGGWLVLARPVSFYYEEYTRGELGCEVDKCVREIIGLGNPVLWWGSIGALLVMIWLLISRRDWRAGAILISVAAGWLPWFWYADHNGRTMFSFYAVAFVPFLAMAVALTLGYLIGPSDATPFRRSWGAAAVGTYLLLLIVAAGALYPLWVGDVIPYDEWWSRLLRIRSWV
jgi:dolichyl-phosphate-mannose-protein mannosyltransferase